MNEHNELSRENIGKWLRVLFYVHLAAAVLSVVADLSDWDFLWIRRGLTALSILALLRLAGADPRYRKAGIYRAVTLGCTLITSLLFSSLLLLTAGSLFSLMATYQEYTAHGELIGEADAPLAYKWNSLFVWSIGVGIVSSLASVVIALLASMAGYSIPVLTNVVIGIITAAELALEAVYLWYLHRTLRMFQEE